MRLAPLLLLLTLALTGCAQNQDKEKDKGTAEPQSAAPLPKAQAAATDWPQVTAPKLDAARALRYVTELCALGPRPVASPAHKKMEEYITAHLAGAQLEDDRFDQTTPDGSFPLRNLVAKFPGTKDGVIILASHYDTKKMPGFVGANDGGSSTGLLLAIADQLRAAVKTKDGRRDGYSVWLVFFDGEEALGPNIDDRDGLYGSKHLAAKWRQDGTAKKIKALILADMIGDQQLNVLRDQNSSPWLLDLIAAAAAQLGYQSHFFAEQEQMIDDHIAFRDAGVPVADLIDFDYGYHNAFWHTPDDTVDKLSPRSLEIVGNVMLQATWMLDQK